MLKIKTKTNMKTKPEVTTVVEVANEGLISLLNENVLVMCMNYFYFGKLIGVNDTCIKLEKAHIIYETGAFSDKSFKDKQFVSDEMYIQTSSIESFHKTGKI